MSEVSVTADGSVLITTREMYQELRAMHDEVRQLRGDLTNYGTAMQADVALIKTQTGDLRADVDKQAEQIEELERWKAWTKGALAVVLFVSPAIGVLVEQLVFGSN